MFKRILLSLGVLTVTVSSVVVGTQALLSDEVVLGANTVSTGSVDLQIWDNSTSTYVDGPVAGFTEELLPGETSGNQVVWLNNASTVELSIAGAAVVTSETVGEYDSDDVTVMVTPMNDAGDANTGPTVTATLTDWETTPQSLLPTIPAGTDQRYHVQVSVDSAVTQANSSVEFNLVFTGTQVL